MSDVWVVRDDLEEVQAAFPTEKAAANYTHGWVGDGLLSITRETLLTPEQAAVIEAAKKVVRAWAEYVYTIQTYGEGEAEVLRPIVQQEEEGLQTAVADLLAAEAQL